MGRVKGLAAGTKPCSQSIAPKAPCPSEAKNVVVKLLRPLQLLWGVSKEMRAASVASALPLVALLLLALQPWTTQAARVDSARFAKISKAVRDGQNESSLDSLGGVDTEALRVARVAQMKARWVGEGRKGTPSPPSSAAYSLFSGTTLCCPAPFLKSIRVQEDVVISCSMCRTQP